MPNCTDRQRDILRAADEYLLIILYKLRNEKGVHADTAIAAASRMAGTFLFRSFNFPLEDLEPGTTVLSDAANEKGPLLITLLGSALSQIGVSIDSKSVADAQVGQGEPPHLTVNATQALLEASLNEVKDKFKLTLEESAHAAVVTASLLIKQSSGVIDPSVAFNIAAYGFVEGSKTVPMPLSRAVAVRKPWYQFW